MKPPKELEQIADVVLNYQPKPKMKAVGNVPKKTAKKGKG